MSYHKMIILNVLRVFFFFFFFFFSFLGFTDCLVFNLMIEHKTWKFHVNHVFQHDQKSKSVELLGQMNDPNLKRYRSCHVS